jgi:hypothetical protein
MMQRYFPEPTRPAGAASKVALPSTAILFPFSEMKIRRFNKAETTSPAFRGWNLYEEFLKIVVPKHK